MKVRVTCNAVCLRRRELWAFSKEKRKQLERVARKMLTLEKESEETHPVPLSGGKKMKSDRGSNLGHTYPTQVTKTTGLKQAHAHQRRTLVHDAQITS